jgi:2-keto-4-pentenoate hydratase/2-oxohepta-3-ene-1,7-dioic acid hydratase in catechol pathway/pimeloyl-ACP methyl ester carboxylesterase
VGKMVRDPNNPLLPNWKHIPIGYNGRSSSIVVSQTTFHRPWGQIKPADSESPVFSPSRNMDFELEVGFITCKENKLGEPVSTVDADNYIYGLCLLNDLSARDIQTWEYQPLGPFLGKSFCTSISPWIVSMEALEPFRCASPTPTVPQLPYLCGAENRNLDIELFAYLKPKNSAEEYLICSTNFKYMYWSMNQQVAHLTSNGTNIKVGDLYGSGTVSGKTPTSFGSMLELCWKGTKPLTLPNGDTRVFLQDHDEIILRGHCAMLCFPQLKNLLRLLPFLFVLLQNCQSLFYYPSKLVFSTPEKLSENIPNTVVKEDTLIWESKKSGEKYETQYWKIYPKNTSKQGRGGLLQLHGNAENLTTHAWSVAWLAQHGFTIFAFDYPGYGKSTGKPTAENTVETAVQMFSFVKQTEANLPICVVGQSLGGAVSIPMLLSSAKDFQKVKGIFLDSTFSSYEGVAYEKLKNVWLTWAFSKPLSFLLDDTYAPATLISQISQNEKTQLSNIPMISFHNPLDPVVPYVEGWKLFEILPFQKKQFVESNSDHAGVLNEECSSLDCKTALAFLQQNCLSL